MTKFLIGGTIVADDSQRWAFEDVTPSQVRAVLSKLADKEPITFDITSPGGDVTAGIAIANMIREASKNGHATRAHVIGIAASMASVITCACDEIDIDESAFMMIHDPWTVTQGNAEDLRKSADILDKMRDAIMSFYRAKFGKTDDELKSLMDAETWFTGAEAEAFAFKANVVKNDEPVLKAAACARALPAFAAAPEAAKKLFVLGQQVVTPAPTAADGSEPADENAPAPAPTPAPVEQASSPAPAPGAQTLAAESEMVSRAECERRVSGMQSAMAKQLAAVQADLTAAKLELGDIKLAKAEADKKALALLAEMENDFKGKLEAQGKELTDAKAEVTRLATELAQTKSELTSASSALEASNKALATLNANVNTPSVRPTRTVDARQHLAALPPADRAAFYAAHAHEVDNHLSVTLAE